MVTRVIILTVLLGTSSALAVVEAAKPAAKFVDSIGVNTHYGNSIFVGGNAYADPRIDGKLAELGVKHLRDHSYNDEALAKIDGLYSSFGIKANLILGETTRSPADLVNLLKAHPGYEGIEGLNEPDFNNRSYGGFTDHDSGANDYDATRAFQNDLYAAVKGDPLTANRTILSPAMGTPSNSSFLSPINFDVMSLHSYPGGREPSFNLDSQISAVASLRGSKPLMSTETGYYNQPASETGSIPENISGKYVPRLYAEYFNRGVDRAYAYELADQGPDTTQREQNFGLLRFDMTKKPAFTALENLIDLMDDPGGMFTPGALDYTLSSAASQLHHTLLQKSNGNMYLLLWQELASYNRTSEVEIFNSSLAVTLTTAQTWASMKVYFPNNSANPFATLTNTNSINLSVPDQMMVVEMTPAPEPGAFLLAGVAMTLAAMRRRR